MDFINFIRKSYLVKMFKNTCDIGLKLEFTLD